MSKPSLLAGVLALALIPAAAGCGDDESSTSAASKTDETAAQPAPAGAPKLDGDEQRALEKVQQAFTDYCADKKTEPVGSVALAESLLDFGADVETADGTTLGETLGQSRDQLRECGAKDLAKRLDTALKAAS